MKKLLNASLVSLLALSFQATGISAQEEGTVTVTTTFLADIVEEIAGDTVSIETIVPAGGDPHLYTASASDLGKITEADAVLYHGLHFEAQMADVLEGLEQAFAVTENFNEDDLIYVSEDSDEVDPHYWFDHELYRQSVTEAEAILSEAFPEHKDLYNENTQAYLAELDELEAFVSEKVAELPEEDRILVTPHDAFTYFAREHDFTVYSPQGISTESEVSNEAIATTVDYIVQNEVPAIFLDTTSNPQAMEKLQEGVEEQGGSVRIVGGEGQELYSDSLAAKGQENDNYIDMYKHNVTLIVDNLLGQ